MKRNFLFMSVLAFLFMVGCSQEETTPNGEDSGNREANTSYMAVNLISSDVTGTRAAAGYEDGSSEENKVSKVRFYFFTDNGAIANVKYANGGYVNYYDWTPADGEQTDDRGGDDVESILAATIVINTKESDKLPQRVAAVLNPTSDLGNTSMSFTQLREVYSDYTTLTTSGRFVMFNSVYGDGGAEVSAVAIKADHLQKTVEGAKAKPITIYVERNVAKVRVTLAPNIGFDSDKKLALKDKDGNALKVGGEQVYLKLGGWSLSAETDNGRLVKKIDPTWISTWWNGNHRSFWAINSPSAQNRYYNYNAIGNDFTVSMYTNENALDYTDNNNLTKTLNRTKVILKGTLCKEDGSPFTIVRHLGTHFADTYSATVSENLPALKKNILSQLSANNHNYYYETTEGGKQVRKQIETDDLQIIIADQQQEENSQNNCYVYAQLTDAAKEKTWYDSNAEDAAPIVATTINEKLKNKDVVDRALVWNSGMTYYYYEIIHDATGGVTVPGVVRNHIYDTKVIKIAGLGTPIYDPDKVIYPEKPDSNDHFIAAQINIFSWRVVMNDYELEW